MTNTNPLGRLGRRDALRVGGVTAAALVAVPGLAACSRTEPREGQSTLDALREQGFIRAAINNEPPFGFIDEEGNVTGEAPELLRAIAKEMGIDEVQAETVAWDGLIPGLKANRFDVVAAGMYITPERCAEVAFAEPDYKVLQAFMVPKGNPDNIETFETFAENPDLKVAVLNASVEQEYAEGAGVPAEQMELGDNAVGMIELLEKGRVNAVGLSTFSLNYQLKQRNMGDEYEVTEGFTPVVDGEEVKPAGAFAFRKGDTDLLDAFNEVLADFKQNGRLTEIGEPFGFDETAHPGDLTTEELCSE
ncbi:ectoine/hydroxyectoine ABC transporter substrate-binding protein EhuB [Streptomonospora nanhaiensis]|uniref:Polar amino acid transport system substrate-binding protein n=1 Tax=Streptomonospora nanhaiensis TaxID=1323731 RepID=A0A853BRD8_9ACTN|nr:ectoine/hydroxyectoine ABC transporter substrate-binding protein EhuB [Streptomonospora nanhaiensis]MBV2367055.1 ectoine/hydroxyectoine ABC transporter substrate-binding protein EhuB [Streptomonospora nanhaiensis]MBX9387232.1 ectoine/hydroxyectoine ABC transporter substrate-binding protein EhuB [Streptomonospora nanhaiensis]NYI97560.1 polar amino acid transport system substrate-binding protein [Streptomonospora nanhaiensis]